MNIVSGDMKTSATQTKLQIAMITRYMDIAGFSISFVAVLLSLIIFTYFRSLSNTRTKIHMNLFLSIFMQVFIRLVLYIDQEITRTSFEEIEIYTNGTKVGMQIMPVACAILYVVLEYTITCMFMWMFIEGVYLHKFVVINSMHGRKCHFLYYAAGWGLPVVVTSIWATFTAMHYSKENVTSCWYGYNLLKLYWILEGPRVIVIVTNFLFLLNIMRVLIIKLRKDESSEIVRARKAVKAALVLLPLLGITNGLNMIQAPLEGNVWRYGIWSYTTHFFRSFQGLFIAIIYCFMNNEVITVVKKYYQNYMAMKNTPKRPSRKYSIERSRRDQKERSKSLKIEENKKSNWIPLQWFKSKQTPQPIVSLTEIVETSNNEPQPHCSKDVIACEHEIETQVTVHHSAYMSSV